MLKLSLSDEVLMEIGKITVTFALIEESLAEIIGIIVTHGGRPPGFGSIVTAELSFRQRVGTLDSLLIFALGKEHEVIREFAKVKRVLSEAEQHRNCVVHSVWMNKSGAKDPHATIRMKTSAKQKKGLRLDREIFDLDALQRITDVIGNAYCELCKFQLRFQEE